MIRGSKLAHPDDALRRLARGKKSPIGAAFHDRRPRESKPPRPWWLLSVIASALLVGGIVALPFLAHRDRIVVTGLRSGAFITKEQLLRNMVSIRITPFANMRAATLRIDDTPLRVLEVGDSLRWLAPNLQDGEHRLTVRSGERFLWRAPATRVIRFTVDSVPPAIELDASPDLVPLTGTYTLRGRVEEGARVVIDGKSVTTNDGAFTKKYRYPPVGALEVYAIDKAGNQSKTSPSRRIAYPAIRGVHLSAEAWVSPGLKQAVFRMADAARINTVQIDLKDDNGIVVYDSALAQVASLGSGAGIFDLRDAVAEMHSRGIRVMGRIAVFRDPVLVRSALRSGRPEDVVLNAEGGAYESEKGVFTNPFSNRVHDYNIAIAREAADAGVDDILFDYVARPLGDLDDMRFTGALGNTENALDQAMVTFLRKAARSLVGTPTRVGVTVFGVSARFPRTAGQNVRTMSAVVDYVAPIVFPSDFRSGYLGVDTPSLNPATIVDRALTQFQDQVAESGAVLLPWLQDFSSGPFDYGAKQVRAQIDASLSLGIDGFLVWDPKAHYSALGFPTGAVPIEIANRSAVRAAGSGPGPTAATVAPVVVAGTPSPSAPSTAAQPAG